MVMHVNLFVQLIIQVHNHNNNLALRVLYARRRDNIDDGDSMHRETVTF